MKHGWAYMDAVTQAIETWSAVVTKRDPATFLHHGLDLRHAVERDIFFRVVNDVTLQLRFDARIEREPLPARPADPWSALIELYQNPNERPNSRGIPQLPPLSPFRRWRSRAANLSRLGKPAFIAHRVSSSADLLFLCIHPKFASFFLPVTQGLGDRAAFLTINDEPLEAHLDTRDLACVGLRPICASEPANPLLRHFRHLCGTLDSLSAMMTRLKPRAVVVPEGNAPVYELALLAGRAQNIRTICVQHGAPAYTNPGFRNWHFDDVLVWGDAFVEPFARHNRNQHFSVAGTPALLPEPADRKKPLHSVGFFLQKNVTVIPEEEWHQLLEFIVWTAQTFQQLEVVVRDHPSQPHLSVDERALLGGLTNIRFMPPPNHSLNDVLAASDVVVATASTTLLEAVQSGAIPFIFGTAYPKDFPDITSAGAAVHAPGPDQARAFMTRLVMDSAWQAALQEGGKALRPHLFAATGAQAACRIRELLF